MNRPILCAAVIAVLYAPSSLSAAGPTLSQHGGRATGQAGAFVARAVSPLALAYNPAGIAQLAGFQAQAGLDFTAPRDDYESATGDFAANHIITLAPAVYATYHLPEDRYPFVFGFGVDSAAWYLVEWNNVFFPGRFVTRRQEASIFDAQAAVAYAMSDRWSVGGGVHYYFGTLGEGRNGFFNVTLDGITYAVEAERLAEANADGIGFDLGILYTQASWGWGLAFDSGAEIEGTGDVEYEARDIPDPVRESLALFDFNPGGRSELGFDLPWEARTGFWLAPQPELRVELDLAWAAWSALDETRLVIAPDPFRGTSSSNLSRSRDWDDTLSVRLGLEWDAAEHWRLASGLAWEPSPVPDDQVEPGFPRSDAYVLAVGAGYEINNFSFDFGYSFHLFDDREVTGQEPRNPDLGGTYSTRDQVFAISAHWRL